MFWTAVDEGMRAQEGEREKVCAPKRYFVNSSNSNRMSQAQLPVERETSDFEDTTTKENGKQSFASTEGIILFLATQEAAFPKSPSSS